MGNNGSCNSSAYDNRYLTFNWWTNSQNIGENYTEIGWNLVGAGGSTTYYYTSGNFKVVIEGDTVYNSSTRINLYNGTQVASGTKRIYHDNDGKKSFSAYIEAGIYYYAVNCSGSGSWSLPQIPRYSTITSASNFNDEENPTIKFTNPSNGYFSLRAKIEAGGDTQLITRDLSKTATSCTFNLTDTERETLRNLAQESNSLSVRFTICCMDGNTELSASYLDKTMTIVNANPTLKGWLEYRDTNSTVTAVTGDSYILVKDLSTLQVELGSTFQMITKKEAIPKNYVFSIDDKTVSVDYTSEKILVDLGNFTTSGIHRLNLRAYDSRNNSVSTYEDIEIFDYDKPVIKATIKRLNNWENSTTLKVSGTYSKLTIGDEDKNTLNTIQYRYRETGGDWGEWTDFTSTISDGKFSCTDVILSLDNTKSYEFEIQAIDNLQTTTMTLKVDVGKAVFFISTNKQAVGVNCSPPSNAPVGSIWVEDSYGQRNISQSINYVADTEYQTNEYIRGKRICKKYVEGTVDNSTSTLLATKVDKYLGHNLMIATNSSGTQVRKLTSKVLESSSTLTDVVYQSSTSIYLNITNSTYSGRSYYGFIYYTKNS